jgi:hypothetical protein
MRISIFKIDCKNVDYNIQLNSAPVHGKWKLQEVETEEDKFQADYSDLITDEPSQHQYNSGTFIDISNTLNDEIRNTYDKSIIKPYMLAGMLLCLYLPAYASRRSNNADSTMQTRNSKTRCKENQMRLGTKTG